MGRRTAEGIEPCPPVCDGKVRVCPEKVHEDRFGFVFGAGKLCISVQCVPETDDQVRAALVDKLSAGPGSFG